MLYSGALLKMLEWQWGADYDAFGHYVTAIRSVEFRERILTNLLQAFTEKRRLLFIHIPKCAGTDLSATLASRYPAVTDWLQSPNSGPEEYYGTLRTVVSELDVSDTVVLQGHFSLGWMLAERLLRVVDQIFTIVRDPVERTLSGANYVLRTLLSDSQAERVDTRGWLDQLGIERIPADPSAQFQKDLLKKILHNEEITPRNLMCKCLGGDLVSLALEQIVISNIEIATIETYNHWLRERWQLDSSARLNQAIGKKSCKMTWIAKAIRICANSSLKTKNFTAKSIEV